MASTNKTNNIGLSQFIGEDRPSWLTDYNNDMEKIDGNMLPVGAVTFFANDRLRENHLYCDGSAYDPAEYPKLFAEIGNTFGGTTQNPLLPDLNGRTPVGMAATDEDFNTVGKTGGEKTHKLSASELPSRTVLYTSNSYGTLPWGTAPLEREISNRYSALCHHDEESGLVHNNMQPYLVLSAQIKCK